MDLMIHLGVHRPRCGRCLPEAAAAHDDAALLGREAALGGAALEGGSRVSPHRDVGGEERLVVVAAQVSVDEGGARLGRTVGRAAVNGVNVEEDRVTSLALELICILLYQAKRRTGSSLQVCLSSSRELPTPPQPKVL